jgi:glycerol kinase
VWSEESDLVSTRRSDRIFTPQTDGEAAHRRWRRAVERAKGWLDDA